MKTFKQFLEESKKLKKPSSLDQRVVDAVHDQLGKKKMDVYNFPLDKEVEIAPGVYKSRKVDEAYPESEKKSHKTKPVRFLDLMNKTFDDAGPKSPMPIIKKIPGTPPVPMPDLDDEPVIFKKSPIAKKSTSVKRA